MSKIKIGWAEVDITPSKKVSLLGQFAERISEYVEKPLTATAMAISTEEDSAIFCSCDLTGADWKLLTEVRRRLVEKKAPFDPNIVIISATHPHTSIYSGGARTSTMGGLEKYRKLLEENLAPNQKYVESAPVSQRDDVATPEEVFELLSSRLSEVILSAWENRKEGSFVNAFGRAPVGMCRRTVYSDGSAQMWGDTNTAVFQELEGGNDSGIELLYVFDENKNLSGIVANLACPAQCVQHRLFVSPDFWGEVKMLLRKRFGENLFLLPQCSAAGDQCPVDLVRWVEPESDLNDPNCIRTKKLRRKAGPSMFDLSGMRLTGRRIATEIIQVLEDGLDPAQSDVVFEHRVLRMNLPVRRATLSDLAAAKRGIREYLAAKQGDVDYNDAARLQVHFGILNRGEFQDEHDCVEEEIHVIRLGSIAFATNPFELFLDYGNQIKARAICEQTFLVQLACGVEGYLPTEKAEKGGHYSAFISSGLVGHEGGDLLVRQTLKNIGEMFS